MKITSIALPILVAAVAANALPGGDRYEANCAGANCPEEVKPSPPETQTITSTAESVTVTKSVILPQTVVETPTVTQTSTNVVKVVTEIPTVTESVTASTAITSQAPAATVVEVVGVTESAPCPTETAVDSDDGEDYDDDVHSSAAGPAKVGAAALVAVGSAFMAFA